MESKIENIVNVDFTIYGSDVVMESEIKEGIKIADIYDNMPKLEYGRTDVDNLYKPTDGVRFCDICHEDRKECKGHAQLFRSGSSSSRTDLYSRHKSSMQKTGSGGLERVKQLLSSKTNRLMYSDEVDD